MKITAKFLDVNETATGGLVLWLNKGETQSPLVKKADKALDGHITQIIKDRDFSGNALETLSFDTLGQHPAKRILIIGLGEKADVTAETIRQASGKSATAMKQAGIKKYISTLARAQVKQATPAELAQAIAEGALLALYTFDKLKSEKETKKIDELKIVARSTKEEGLMTKGAKKGITLAESACLARDLINSPGNFATPSHLADQARKISREFGLRTKILDAKAIEKLQMGGLMGVASGSHQPAKFIIMEWLKGPKTEKPILLVGKGLTFDTGGISIKPSGGMEEMKSDMSGGAAVIGAMRAISALKMKVNVVGLVPATENMPGGSAIKPGDVLKGLSGVTMEVINTDAEGRLILADALAYAERYEPDCVIDMATLTGACMVALGDFASGLFGNDETLIKQLKETSEEIGEPCWPMPLWPEYEAQIKSDVADIKNVGPRAGGAITAAAFLKKHVGAETKWAHIDVAGTAYTTKARHYITKGGVGLGVRHMVRFVEKRTGAK